MTSLPAGSSDLAQATFKMIRNMNLMRFQTTEGEKKTEKQYQDLKEEMESKIFDQPEEACRFRKDCTQVYRYIV